LQYFDDETTMDDMTKAKDKRSDTVARKAFRTSRLAEFASIDELTKATGQPVENWPLVIVKELADNAADEAEEAGVAPVIEIEIADNAITVSDHGRGIKPAMVKALVDYATKTSSRAAVVAPSRGQQGNALQSIIAMGHALDPSADTAVLIESQGVAHHHPLHYRPGAANAKDRTRHCAVSGRKRGSGANGRIWPAMMSAELPEGWAWAS
jgi:hypothetical protein